MDNPSFCITECESETKLAAAAAPTRSTPSSPEGPSTSSSPNQLTVNVYHHGSIGKAKARLPIPTSVMDSSSSQQPIMSSRNSKASVRPSTSPDQDWRDKLNLFLKASTKITIEPIIFLHLMSLLITALVLNDLALDRACRINLNFSTEICDQLAARNVSGEYAQEEQAAQSLIASIATWRFAIEYSVPIFLVLLLGSWSDVYGRKFPLILPMVGSVIKNLGLILCIYFPSWDAYTVILFVLVPTTVTGSYPIFSMAYHSYIVDSTEEKYRTVRFGLANACSTFGVSLGTVLGGYLFSKTSLGFVGLFGIAGAIEILTIVLTCALIQNTKGNYDGEEIDPPSAKEALRGMLNLRHLLEAFKTTLKPRPRLGRLKLWALMFILFCGSAPYYGESSVVYLFLRLRFGWGAGEYGFFGMYQTIAGGTGLILSMGLLSWWFGMEDSLVGLLGCLSQITSCFVYAFATTTSIYFAPLIDILNGAMTVAARSMTTKAVEPHEQGKLLSFLAGLDSVNPVLSNVAYNALYKATLSTLPGAFFLLSASLAGPPFCVFMLFFCKHVFQKKR